MAEGLAAELGSAHTEIATMREQMAAMGATLEKLQRHVFGKRSEKMPPVKEELRKQGVIQADPEATLAKRRQHLEPPRDLRRPVYWSPAPMAGVS